VIEMVFLRLKHHFLFTIPLTNIAALTKGVDFYLTESNNCMPHSALMGATPEESITGKWPQEKMMAMKFAASGSTYGSPRVHDELTDQGYQVRLKTVAKYMQEMGLDARLKKKFRVQTTSSKNSDPIANRLFKVEDRRSLPKAHKTRPFSAESIYYPVCSLLHTICLPCIRQKWSINLFFSGVYI